ncbi:MAG: hypothetical protein Q9170_004389 [Blastenia crenularia]
MSSNVSKPAYVVVSPIGFHATDVLQYLSHHPTPVSSDPDRLEWATEESQMRISHMFLGIKDTPGGVVLANLFIYNKTRDADRICPSCRRIYRVGEGPMAYQSFEQFLDRPKGKMGVGSGTMEEQDLSGACCGVCFNALSETSLSDNDRGEELAKMQRLAKDGGYRLRKSTPEEENESGIKIVWEKLDA